MRKRRTITDSHTVCPTVLSKRFWKSVSLGAVTTFLGSLFQGPTTFWVKSLFLLANLNVP